MKRKGKVIIYVLLVVCGISCSSAKNATVMTSNSKSAIYDQEKTAIIAVLKGETAAAFNRDYQEWQSFWLHENDIEKSYIDYPNNKMSNSTGWGEISRFVKKYIEDHPEPAPVPKLADDFKVRLYGSGAWVSYNQHDAKVGFKREFRLMEKHNGEWKIAGMQTIIYGFEEALDFE